MEPSNDSAPNQAPGLIQPEGAQQPSVPPGEQKPVTPPPVGGGSKKLLIILISALVAVLLAGGAYFAFFRGDDEPEASQQTQQETENAEETAEIDCDEGFTEFEGDNIGLHFCYPVAWGDASLEDGEEVAMGHLTAGSQKLIKFSRNSTVAAGLMSKDWTHNDAGHGGVPGQYGYKSLDQAKEAKEHTKPAYVYVDTDSQFAYIRVCAEFCTSGPARIELSYTVRIEGNDTYEVIEFAQAGDDLGQEFYDESGGLSQDKIDAADLSLLFKKTDSRFTVLQQVADTVRN